MAQNRVPQDAGSGGVSDEDPYVDFRRGTGKLYKAESNEDATLSGGDKDSTFDTSSLTSIRDTVWVPRANELWAFNRNQNIQIFDIDTEKLTINARAEYDPNSSISNTTISIAYDPANDNIIISGEAVTSLDRSSGDQIFEVSNREKVDVDETGDIYGVDNNGSIAKYDSSGTELNRISTSFTPGSCCLDATGNLYIMDQDETVHIYDRTDITQSASVDDVTSTFRGPGLIVSCFSGGNSSCIVNYLDKEVYKIESDGSIAWKRQFRTQTLAYGITRDDKVVISNATGIFVLDASDGSTVYSHQAIERFRIPDITRGVVAPRAGAFPSEYQ